MLFKKFVTICVNAFGSVMKGRCADLLNIWVSVFFEFARNVACCAGTKRSCLPKRCNFGMDNLLKFSLSSPSVICLIPF